MLSWRQQAIESQRQARASSMPRIAFYALPDPWVRRETKQMLIHNRFFKFKNRLRIVDH